MARLHKILVAFDGSPHSRQALQWAMDLSCDTSGTVVAVLVSEPLHLSARYNYAEVIRDAIKEHEEREQKILAEAKDAGSSRGLAVKTELLHGNVAQAILDYAQTEQMDLIVAGTKGYGAIGGLLMGGVTRNLVSLSRIPVLVVKD